MHIVLRILSITTTNQLFKGAWSTSAIVSTRSSEEALSRPHDRVHATWCIPLLSSFLLQLTLSRPVTSETPTLGPLWVIAGRHLDLCHGRWDGARILRIDVVD